MESGSFTEANRLEKQLNLGDSLEKLNVIEWGIFRPTLKHGLQKGKEKPCWAATI